MKMAGDLCMIPDSEPFVLGEKIGTGSFSVVYKAIDKNTEATIAIKSYRMKLKDRTYFERAACEIAFLKLLEHPNIISYVCSDIKKYYMYLGIEYSPHGSLMNYMQERGNLPEKTVQTVMKQILSAVCYLHSKSIFHADVKPENVIIVDMGSLKIKLTDFGLTEVVMKNQTIQKKPGSFFYISPEILLGFPADYTSDLYSCGVVMYEMLYCEKPFPTKVSREEYLNLLRKRVPVKYPEEPSAVLTPECIELVKSLLSYDKDKRLSGVNLLKHHFVQAELVKDQHNHYQRAYNSFVTGVDLVKEKKYGQAYIFVTESILHLQIFSHETSDTGLRRYTKIKIHEFKSFCEKVLRKILNDESNESLELHYDTERLRCLLQSSPGLLAAYDMCIIGEMYFMQNNQQHGADLIKNGLQILLGKIPQEPDGVRRKLLRAKIAKWMNILEDCGPGPSHAPDK